MSAFDGCRAMFALTLKQMYLDGMSIECQRTNAYTNMDIAEITRTCSKDFCPTRGTVICFQHSIIPQSLYSPCLLILSVSLLVSRDSIIILRDSIVGGGGGGRSHVNAASCTYVRSPQCPCLYRRLYVNILFCAPRSAYSRVLEANGGASY